MPEWDFPNPATPPGSGPYYVVRFAPPAQRDRLARLFAWRAELAHMAARANDPGAARLKLDWWGEELARAHAGTPRHPLMQALAPLLCDGADLAPWRAMLDATGADIHRDQPPDQAAFARRCEQLGGTFAALLGDAAGERDATIARRHGAYHEAVTRVRDLALHLQRGHCPLPADRLAAAGLEADALHRADAARLAACLEQTLEPLAQAVHSDRATTPDHLGPASRLAAQARRLHHHLRRRGYPVLRERVEITPLGYLWSAWRA